MNSRLADMVLRFAWRLFEARIQATITDRLIAFYEGLIERDQIGRPIPPIMTSGRSLDDDGRSSAGHVKESGRVLPLFAFPRPPTKIE